jgi:hypothetical protein
LCGATHDSNHRSTLIFEQKYGATAKKSLAQIEFVTACDFCNIGTMHDRRANEYLVSEQKKTIVIKDKQQRDKALHDCQ